MSATYSFPGLVAQVNHGPGMHAPLLLILVAIAVVGGLVYLVKSRRSSARDPDPFGNPEPDGPAGDRRDPANGRSPEASGAPKHAIEAAGHERD